MSPGGPRNEAFRLAPAFIERPGQDSTYFRDSRSVFQGDGRSSDRAVSEKVRRVDGGGVVNRRPACQRRSDAHDRGRKMGPLGADQGTAAFVADATGRVLERRPGGRCRSTLAGLGNLVAVVVCGLGCERPTITVGAGNRRGRRKRKRPEGCEQYYKQQPCGYSAAHVPHSKPDPKQ